MKRWKLFASSGSCFNKTYKIYGTSSGICYNSAEFCGTMNGQNFWDDLAAFAKQKNVFVELYS